MTNNIIDTKEIILEFQSLCAKAGKILTREEYRKEKTLVTSTQIEKQWGTWKNFVTEAADQIEITRKNIQKTIKNNKLVVSSVQEGSEINEEALQVLENYCKSNKAELVILWGKQISRGAAFSPKVYNRIKNYLATEVIFLADKSLLIKDFMLSISTKNPLANLDKISTGYSSVITGNPKQYMQILPYKQEDKPRIAYTTGTISKIDYNDSISKQLDANYHTFGGILIENANKETKMRNLICKDGKIYDMDAVYTNELKMEMTSTSAMVLGDMHFPEHDQDNLQMVIDKIKKLNPKVVVLHDIASWESVNHHEAKNYLDKAKNNPGTDTESLQTEYDAVLYYLKEFAKALPEQKIKIVHSNHDDFINKWLNEGEFIKDTNNAAFGAKLFIKYLEGKHILEDAVNLPKNVEFLKPNSKFEVSGFQLGEHGDKGLSGSKANPKFFTKSFNKSVTAHTHSPMIFENNVVTGTNSKLKLRYNQSGFTNWAHADVIIYNNGTCQILF